MVQERIMDLFFENPSRTFHIRGISRELKIPKTSVSYHISKLIEQKLILKRKTDIFPSFQANEQNELFKAKKRSYFIDLLLISGLMKYIESECTPRSIVLFGSFAKAEYGKDSDIDLFVQSEKCPLNLKKFENKLRHEIHIYFEKDLNNLSPELFNNIINGIKLKGFIKIK